MSRAKRRERRGWIYKCSVGDPDHEWSWVDKEKGGWLLKNHESGENFGGEEWIRSAQSWKHLADLRRGDLILCHQSDGSFRGLVGLTVAASRGYADPDGDRPDRCTTLDIGPNRIAFENPVSLAEIRAALNNVEIGAYAPGKRQSTFHPVEPHVLEPLVELCVKRNPFQHDEIVQLTRLRLHDDHFSFAEIPSEIIRDPIRREMLIEAFERKASWARLARRLYGCVCMIPGCRFELVKEDGELYIEVHHIVAMFEEGSPNDKMNLSVLCPNHHREAHYAKAARRKKLAALIIQEQGRRLARAAV